MSNLHLVALVVKEYDPAIDFFIRILRFELVEDVPSLTNDGRPKRWVVVRPPGAETGILLAVTPRINSGGQVTLDVNQEVSVPDQTTVSATNPNPTVNSRSAQTTVVVASGESIVLAGLIREDNNRGTSGIPLLSKIPILGAAFGRQTLNKRRTELVLIITPKIVSDANQAREVTNELREKLPALKSLLPPIKPPGEKR